MCDIRPCSTWGAFESQPESELPANPALPGTAVVGGVLMVHTCPHARGLRTILECHAGKQIHKLM